MLAAYDQIERVRALRMLDAAQAAMYPQMSGQGAKNWLDGLLERCRGVVADVREVVEELHWNGKVVDIRHFQKQWEHHEAESQKTRERRGGRSLVNRLMGRGR